MWVRSLGWEGPLEEGMATRSSILAWRIPWTEEPGGLRSMTEVTLHACLCHGPLPNSWSLPSSTLNTSRTNKTQSPLLSRNLL